MHQECSWSCTLAITTQAPQPRRHAKPAIGSSFVYDVYICLGKVEHADAAVWGMLGPELYHTKFQDLCIISGFTMQDMACAIRKKCEEVRLSDLCW